MATRILLIDPDLDSATVIKMYFEQYGYEVQISTTGQVGVVEARTWQPNAILLDGHVTDLPLTELCQTLMDGSLTAHIPILVLFHLEERRINLQILEVGVADLLVKPYDIEELMLRVEAAIHLATILE
jgi:DNA-binding response OmpR family regulator